MQATIGRIVHYRVSALDAKAINKRRADFSAYMHANALQDVPGQPGATGHQGHVGNPVQPGQQFPALVVAAWGGPSVNLQVWLDGCDVFWATSRSEGEDEGQWSWPPRV